EQEQEQEQEASKLAGNLASRAALFERSPGQPPSPRKDPAFERISVGRWFPSQQWLDWFAESGIDEKLQDKTMMEVRDKLWGSHDIEWWDAKILTFFEAAIRHSSTSRSTG